MSDLGKIIAELEHQRAAIDRAISALREIAGPTRGEAATFATGEGKTTGQKRHLSPEGRRRIIEATKRRWAAKKAAELTEGDVQSKTATKPASANGKAASRKGHISPGGRKKLAAAMKRRWAAKRAAEASTSTKKGAVSKKTAA